MRSRMIQRLFPILISLIALVALAGDEKLRLAVMEVEDQSGLFDVKARAAATDLLRGQLTQSGKFIIIDKGQQEKKLKEIMKEQKKESHASCYDQSCQITLGQALSADTLLRSQITKLGKTCTLTSEMIDLQKEVVAGGGQARFDCTEDGLLPAIEDVAKKIAGENAPTSPAPNVSAPGGWTLPPLPGASLKPNDTPSVETKKPELGLTKEAKKDKFGIEWLPIPGGTFMMGCSDGDSACDDNEKPSHSVTIRPFRLMRYEATQEQYRLAIGHNPAKFTDCGSNCPVEQIDWAQSADFCAKIGGRLPTEEEWEYAARAGTTTRYYCGNDKGCLNAVAWMGKNSAGAPHPVGQKIPNDFGLFDMLGNVYEWTASCWTDNYRTKQTDCERHLRRGASWITSDLDQLRASDRSDCFNSSKYPNLGVRCAMD